MYLGHLALAYCAKNTFFKKTSLLYLALASLGPDLIDKPLHYFAGAAGRGIAHTLIFFCVLTVIMLLLTPYLSQKHVLEPRVVYVGLLMWLLHLVTDFVQPAVLFWPLGTDGAFYISSKSLLQKTYDFYVGIINPPSFASEVFFDAAALYFLIRSALYKSPDTVHSQH